MFDKPLRVRLRREASRTRHLLLLLLHLLQHGVLRTLCEHQWRDRD
jgi:hypothetical protein